METWLFIVLCVLALINIVAFIMYGVDKKKAKDGKWRTKEATLILSAAVGGSIGALIGMFFFRHKTQKPKFFIGVPAILIAQLALVFVLLYFKVIPNGIF